MPPCGSEAAAESLVLPPPLVVVVPAAAAGPAVAAFREMLLASVRQRLSSAKASVLWSGKAGVGSVALAGACRKDRMISGGLAGAQLWMYGPFTTSSAKSSTHSSRKSVSFGLCIAFAKAVHRYLIER